MPLSAQYTGPLIVLDLLFSVMLVVALCAITAGLGARLLRMGRFQLNDALESLLVSTAVGLGALATAIVLIGLLFGVHPRVLISIVAAAAFLAETELRALPAAARAALASLRARPDPAGLSVCGVLAVVLLTHAALPPTDWDALMYHLRVPAQFLRDGAIRLPDDNPHVAFVGLPHMLYLPLLAAGSAAGPALVSALSTLGLVLTAFALSRRFLDARTAGLGLAVLWGSTIIVVVGITARTDTILAFYLLLVHYLVLRAGETEDARWLLLAAALGGMAFGVKYNALLYLVALAPLGWWLLRPGPKRAATVGLVLAAFLLAASPWLIKNAILLGDPLYPYLGERRLEPWLARLYGGATTSPPVDPAILGAVWRAQARFNLVDFFTAPERITVEGEGQFYHPNLLLLLVPLWLLVWRQAILARLAVPALVYSVLVLALQPATSLRYLIPALAPLTLVALHSVASVLDKLLPARATRLLLWGAALIVLTGTASFIVQATAGSPLRHIVGATSRHAFLRGRTGGYADAVAFVNGHLPADSRLLMLFEARGFYFRVPVLQDNGITNWPFLAPKASEPGCLRAAGFTHVLVNSGAIYYYARRGVDLAPLRLDALERFGRECLTPIYASGGITVFRLGGRGARGSARAR